MELRSGAQPPEALNKINQLLCEKSLPGQFVTLFLFLMNPNGDGEFISAGQNPAYLFRSSTGKIDELVSDSYMLGMFDFATYSSRPLHLDPGDILVIYSDGLTDAEDQRSEMFGDDRLLEIIRQEAPSGSDLLHRRLLNAIETFTHGVPQTDDITLVVVEKY